MGRNSGKLQFRSEEWLAACGSIHLRLRSDQSCGAAVQCGQCSVAVQCGPVPTCFPASWLRSIKDSSCTAEGCGTEGSAWADARPPACRSKYLSGGGTGFR